MCDKCSKKIPVKHWLHIADNWTKKEKLEMLRYLVGKDFVIISKQDIDFLLNEFPYPSFYRKSLEEWLARLKRMKE